HFAAFLFGQQPPAVEWVNQYLVFIPDKFDDEMAGHSDTEKLQPDPSRDLEEKNRERDRDSSAAINHVVEKPVTRIEIVFDIATESPLAKNQVAQSHYS